MLSKEVGYWWEFFCRGLEYSGIAIAWDNFKKEFLDEYFPTGVHKCKEIELLELKRGNMYVTDYTIKFEELPIYSPHYIGVDVEGSKCWKIKKLMCALRLRSLLEIKRFSVSWC